MLKQSILIVLVLCSLSACKTKKETKQKPEMLAEQLFHNVYSGDLARIDSLVSDDMVASYPIFEKLFGTKAIRGREAYKKYAAHFNQVWTDAQITVNEAVTENKSVVLVWSFSAVRTKTTPDSSVVAGKKYSWGGITLFHFNDSGKINLETGEESSPGPIARLEPDSISN